jgi:D-alanyl-D-alanine carboxypeptidase
MKNYLFLFILFISLFCFGQKIDEKSLDKYLEEQTIKNQLMGSVSIIQNGKMIYSKGIGFCDVENQIPNSVVTKYRIGSITKTFTAVLILMAIEEKKLEQLQTIDTFFPKIKNSSKIQIQHLLSHRSGINNFTDNADFEKWYRQKKSKQEMLNIIADGGIIFEPDSKSLYSNSNYVLLTFVLEEVYKKPFKEVLNEKIVVKLGLKNTYYGGKINAENNESNSYRFDIKWNKQLETDMSIPLGAGGIVSTAEDVSTFLDGLFSIKLINQNSIYLMTKTTDGFGLGIFERFLFEKKAYMHTGDIDAFGSIYVYFPDIKLGLILITNGCKNYNEISDEISKKIML